jgi:uncharacterized protein YndB with AHSA1/START domain
MLPLTVTQTLTTSASPEQVWRAFEAVTRWPKTIRTLRKVTLEPRGPLAAGSVIRSVGETGAKRNERVVEAEPPHRLVLAIDDEDFRSRTEYRIAADAEGSEITVTGRLEARGIGQIVRFLLWRERMTPLLKATLRERTQGLVDLAELIAAGG